ncbi:MAG TPA: MFS transporter [Acidimicrobiales bacterium]|nr:MFS transporter [Acidimicrobiales bacterium]
MRRVSHPEGSRWSPVVGLALVAAANQMLWLNFAPITSGAAARLGVSKSAIGWLSELFPLSYVVLAVPIGKALDRWFRTTLLAGATLTALGALVRVVDDRYSVILIGQVLIALGQPAILNAITGTASRYLSTGHRPLGIAVGSAGTFFGFVAAFLLGGVFGASGLETILAISAAFSVAALAVMAVSLLNRAGQKEPAADVEVVSGQALRDLWADPVLRTLAGLVFVGFGAFVALSTWLETLLKPAGVHSSTTDTLLTVMVIAGVVGCAVIPPPAAARRLQAPFLLASAVTSVLAGLLLAAVPGVAAGAIALPLLGLLLLPDLPIVLELAERRAGNSAGSVTAILWLAGNAGGIIIALMVQALQSRPTTAFIALAAAGAAAIPLALALGRQLRVEPSSPLANPAS